MVLRDPCARPEETAIAATDRSERATNRDLRYKALLTKGSNLACLGGVLRSAKGWSIGQLLDDLIVGGSLTLVRSERQVRRVR